MSNLIYWEHSGNCLKKITAVLGGFKPVQEGLPTLERAQPCNSRLIIILLRLLGCRACLTLIALHGGTPNLFWTMQQLRSFRIQGMHWQQSKPFLVKDCFWHHNPFPGQPWWTIWASWNFYRSGHHEICGCWPKSENIQVRSRNVFRECWTFTPEMEYWTNIPYSDLFSPDFRWCLKSFVLQVQGPNKNKRNRLSQKICNSLLVMFYHVQEGM